MEPEVSICIVSWNTRQLLRRCLESIFSRTVGLEIEVIVVDNSSSDGSAIMVEQRFPQVRLVCSQRNLGFVGGSNLAFSLANGAYVLALNPDTELISNAILQLYNHIRSRREVGAIGARLIDAEGNIQHTCACTYPTPWNEFTELCLLNRAWPKSPRFASREMDWWDHHDSREVDCLSGACMMLPIRVLRQLGGFDPTISMYAEDVDLCHRVKKAGYSVYYLSEAVVLHREGASTSKQSSRSFAAIRQREANAYYLQKHRGPLCAMRYRVAVFIGSVFRLILLAILGLLGLGKAVLEDEERRQCRRKYSDLLLWSLGV